MNTLLIYNSNIATSLAANFEGETYFFQIGKAELLNVNFSIDSKIHSILTSEIEKNKFDAIFIPFSLSEDNYIEFIGLRFAFHIRLTKEFGNIQTPIIFYGSENAIEVNKLSKLGSILFSKNVFMTDKVSVLDFKKQVDWVNENFSEIYEADFQKEFLNRNIINPSGNYATHHSVANEWCIYRWAKSLEIENDSLNKIENIVSSNLYFKYLKAKFPISEVQINKSLIGLQDGKVLYIDDEINKGWGIIFKKLRQPRSIEELGADFKNMSSEEIVEESVAKIKISNPDVVILDFRLHDDDFETNNPNNISGYQILKKTKEHNQGIQVIILSATNKILNLLELQLTGADGFILKESPELSVDADFSKQSINNIYTGIEKALPKARFLKKFINYSDKIKELLAGYSKEFILSVSNNLEITFKLLNDSFTEQKFKNYAYLQLFLIIEEWIKQDSVFLEDNKNCYVINFENRYHVKKETVEQRKYEYAVSWDEEKNKNGFYVIKNCTKECSKSFEDTMFKMSVILLFKFGVETMERHEWHQISRVRNTKAAHPENSIVTEHEISILLNFMLFLFNSDNFIGLKETTPQ